MRAIIKLTILISFIVIILANIYYYFDVSRREMINCESPVLIPMPKKGFQYSGIIGMTFNPNGTGMASFSGELTELDTNTTFDVLRIIYFDYSIEYYSYFTLSNFVIKKNVNDSTDDQMFNRLMFDLSTAGRRIRVERLKDTAFLIENTFNPIFICIER
ncbi:TPA: hypothetical protein MYQ36_004479 [Citrobacter braakii]|uniref:FidL n=1 Tax=Citrobacter braakii TaxID=57706 RepID=A0A1V8NWP1_CITBR|nr:MULTISPECIES: hypothetical protein [Citrobacter]EKW2139674.1 hypothetical protein [Citrobacter braakii]MBJ8996561.1 hypothetical protein [Citrobacter braakii]MDM3413269.1 hypothetical protein [Citrobacter sp. Cb018]MDM3453431.1 hypothetical protein [Citrobacter sp. Cb028]MDV0579163.1 hypothetical protein [Citrobacter braakii]